MPLILKIWENMQAAKKTVGMYFYIVLHIFAKWTNLKEVNEVVLNTQIVMV